MRWWIASLVLVAACGESKDQAARTAPAPPSAPAPPPPPSPPRVVDPGRCNLGFNGAVAVAEEVPRDDASITTVYWLGPAEREQAKGALLALACEGKDASISISPAEDATTESIPFGPRTYRLDKGKGVLVVRARVKGAPIAEVSGTIAITAFDSRHIAATIDLAGKAKDGSPVAFSGSLDYACIGLSGCR